MGREQRHRRRPAARGRRPSRRAERSRHRAEEVELVRDRLNRVVGRDLRSEEAAVPHPALFDRLAQEVVGGWVPRDPSARDEPAARPVTPMEDAGSPRNVRMTSSRLPLELRAALVGPSRKAVIGLAVVVAAGILLALWWAWASRAESRPAPVLQRSAGHSSRPGDATPRAEETSVSAGASRSVTVHIAGAVRRPGVVMLPVGSRVADAVHSAGGATPKAALASVNLARILVDGEQVVVLKTGEAPVAVAGGAGAPLSGASTGTLVDLNAATLEQLDGLPGVGPVLAQRILDWRTRNGGFNAVGELQEVAGIGEAKFADLEPRVRV